MGGSGSTRWRGHARRPTVEEAIRLSVGDLRAFLRNPEPQAMAWRWARDGKTTAEVGVSLSPTRTGAMASWPDVTTKTPHRALSVRGCASRTLEFAFGITRKDSVEPVYHSTMLIARAMPFGGLRWWYVCPNCGSVRSTLYLPFRFGGRAWRCRRCYDLRYKTQRADLRARAEIRMQRVSQRVTQPWEFWDESLPPKPKRMHGTTYVRHQARWQRAADVVESAYCLRILRFLNAMDRKGLLRS